ncbi:protein big brother-like [Aphis craccivora]|uniref:Protein big brother-like n=1 Tax=Aphis craccivora TaxID=307492 RepID=A0A6G0Y8F3_APHCR|nr:protein big brother-like [Aphis craccivora]
MNSIYISYYFFLQVRYTSYRDRPHEERQNRFQMGCREGHVDIAFATTGTNLQLMFTPNMPSMTSYHQPTIGYCDFEKEQGMVRKYISFCHSYLIKLMSSYWKLICK